MGRVIAPGPDSTRIELRTSLVIGVVFAAGLSVGLVRSSSGSATFLGVVYLVLSLRMCLAMWWLHKPSQQP